MNCLKQSTERTDFGCIVFPAGGRVAVYFLAAISTNFDPLLHSERSIVLSLLTVNAQIGKRLCVEALAFHGRVPAFSDRVVDCHVKVGDLSGLPLCLALPV